MSQLVLCDETSAKYGIHKMHGSHLTPFKCVKLMKYKLRQYLQITLESHELKIRHCLARWQSASRKPYKREGKRTLIVFVTT